MDPISNMVISIKNASLARKSSVVLPYSKMKNAIAECLKKEGYIGNLLKKNVKNKSILELSLIYNNKEPKVSGVKRISKQSRRVYLGKKDIHRVRGGAGLLIVSTPAGIMSGKQAVREKIGGEALFEIW